MPAKGFGAIKLTGGTDGCLDAIDGNLLTSGDVGWVINSTAVYHFTLKEVVGIENPPYTISPDVNPGDKKWALTSIDRIVNNLTIDAPYYLETSEIRAPLESDLTITTQNAAASGSSGIVINKDGDVHIYNNITIDGTITAPTPSGGSQLATKQYVDDVFSNQYVDFRNSVKEYIATPPLVPSDGDRYLIKTPGDGAWAGYVDYITQWDGDTSQWLFYQPDSEGMATWVESENKLYIYKGTGNGWDYISLLSDLFRFGTYTITNGVTASTITFTSPLTGADYNLVTTMNNVTDPQPSLYTHMVTEKTITDFTVIYSGEIDSSNYKLDWFIKI